MKASSVQQAFKSLASRIHPQLPLSERESQRLLNALTSSFRSQLEHHHHNHDAAVSAASASASASTQPSLSPITATDRHLASILTNPLLTKPVHQQLKSKSKHPIALFEDQVAAGRANLPSARLCLEAFRNSLSSLTPAQVKDHITRYAAGSRALRWLWTSAYTRSLSFALDARFCSHLAFFLIHEGKEAALWELIDTPVATSPNLTAREASLRKGLLLSSIVKTHLSGPDQSLESALSAFFRALDTSQTSHASTTHAGVHLTQTLVKQNLFSQSDVALYDKFIDSVPRWTKNHPDRAIYRIANLTIHHPTTPSADPALDFIRELRPLASHPFLNPSTASQRSTVFAFFFDTVALLQKQERYDDALWVMEFMQQRFPDEFAPPRRQSSAVPAPSKVSETSEATSPHSSFPEWKVPELG
ncbi:hypothetical protein E4T48_00945 [Aureobasidium sp. EXF-10727]|nr:hypothetical protein E4T48_00945 [Aureobasidium sp. EXF-10727]